MEKLCLSTVLTLLWAEAVAGASGARCGLCELFQQNHSRRDLCMCGCEPIPLASAQSPNVPSPLLLTCPLPLVNETIAQTSSTWPWAFFINYYSFPCLW